MSGETPQNLKQIVAQGVSAFERDDFMTALTHFRKVLDAASGFADVRNRAGLCLAMLGDYEAALVELDEALAVNEAYAEAHLNRAIVLNELSRFEEAEKAFHRAGELDRRWPEEYPSDAGNRIAVTHAQLGDLYLVLGKASRAVDQYRSALEVRPTFLDIQSKLGEALIQMGDFEAAKEEIDEILEKNPEFTGARIRLGVVLHKLGDTEGSVREWKLCAEQDPDDLRIKGFLSAAEHSAGDPAGDPAGDSAGDPA